MSVILKNVSSSMSGRMKYIAVIAFGGMMDINLSAQRPVHLHGVILKDRDVSGGDTATIATVAEDCCSGMFNGTSSKAKSCCIS